MPSERRPNGKNRVRFKPPSLFKSVRQDTLLSENHMIIFEPVVYGSFSLLPKYQKCSYLNFTNVINILKRQEPPRIRSLGFSGGKVRNWMFPGVMESHDSCSSLEIVLLTLLGITVIGIKWWALGN